VVLRALLVVNNATGRSRGRSTFGSCEPRTNPAGLITDVDLAAVDKTWDVNLRAPLVWARAAWQGSMKERGGAIVSIGSVGGLQPSPAIGAYNVSKAAVHHLTRQLAHELAPSVRVNAVAAAIVKTKLSEMLWSWDEEAVANAHPLQRLGSRRTSLARWSSCSRTPHRGSPG
jgi:NAD(P)-dependent dehydrogenase (short-subunit alcohol dehydrogenase family)